MTTLTNIDEINKIIRSTLIEQSQLPGDKVLNALSIRGDYLDQLVEGEEYSSIDINNSIILFELVSRPSDADVSFDDDQTVTFDRSFTMNLIIYGDSSSNLATVLVARLRTDQVRTKLYNQGVYVEYVSEPTITNEYKNETMWLRNDIQIEISCRFKVSKIIPDHETNTTNIITILED